MLKALEVFGFKSFADKTRFEFPPGITVVVGPNGSGKSNIVDAIKWVLGEQSAKSLRGKEMADVIFKGSGSVAGGRRPANTAEATVIFDNADRRLPIDAPEVHVTRRVYRSGEGEYLINRQPARLKDIRDLFRGTGVGVDAYSLIEQGKVDRLLQASPKDRRAIFEEAAGISRFKAKKIEAQRRLERVEQNLLRLSDIVEEVENRLKSVRNQAAKAKRYREYAERLQELRTQVALSDWRKLTARIDAYEADLAELRQQQQDAAAQQEAQEAALLEIETAILTAGEQIRAGEAAAATTRAKIAECETTIAQQLARVRELEEEAALHRKNLAAMSDRAGDLLQRLAQTQQELASAQSQHESLTARLTAQEAALAGLDEQLARDRQRLEARRGEHASHLAAAAALASRLSSDESQLRAAQQAAEELRSQLAALHDSSVELAEALAAAQQRQREHAQQAQARQSDLEDLRRMLDQTRRLHAERQEDLSQLLSRRRGLAERASLLEELERTLEGLSAGVKEALVKLKGQTSGPLTLARGVLADLMAVRVEHAAAIDIALGDVAQAIVVAGGLEEVEAVIEGLGPLAARVTFIPTDEPRREAEDQRAAEADAAVFPQPDGVVGRADTLVEMPAEFFGLARRFLGQTWVVKSRSDAVRLWRQLPPRAAERMVTLDGELLEPSGALSLGPRQSATSIISRRSELRSLRSELAVLETQTASARDEAAALKEQVQIQERAVAQQTQAAAQSARDLADATVHLRTVEERWRQSQQQIAALEQKLAEATARCEELSAAADSLRQQWSAAQATAAALQQQLAVDQTLLAQGDAHRQQALAEVTQARVEQARSEQRLEGLRARLAQFEDDQRERDRACHQVRAQLRACEHRRRLSELEILRAESEMAASFLAKEALAAEIAAATAARDQAAARRAQAADEAQRSHKALRRLQEEQHQLELAAGQVRHERQTLLDRMKEDYSIDLAALTLPGADAQALSQRAEVEAEIESLRRKINQIGAVNLDALQELDELEARYAHLSSQHRDLTEAKQALERIIHKINADSRRLFLETLEAIRANFQALYRKAFGGGKADIALEEGVDVLDAGVEIIATPPGKPSFNNSLLSGGEKALTAVALLLAIFQFRPSPFCVLDEVDAPFDEANIGRFIDVLNDFLGWTKFVIVTHSKKTMTAATTLYGVTMQESGVSKRVSVRFDDVTDDGHIRQEALDRHRDEPEAEVA